MSKPDQPLGHLAGSRDHHLEALRRRETALVAKLELELLLFRGCFRVELQNGRHSQIIGPRAARPADEEVVKVSPSDVVNAAREMRERLAAAAP